MEIGEVRVGRDAKGLFYNIMVSVYQDKDKRRIDLRLWYREHELDRPWKPTRYGIFCDNLRDAEGWRDLLTQAIEVYIEKFTK